MRVGVIGLGKLGLPLACLFGSNPENQVTGLDINEEYVKNLIKGKHQTSEPDCNYSNVTFTSSYENFTDRTDIAFLCVNTPSNLTGGMDYFQVITACESLYRVVRDRTYHLVVCSTVLPGACKEIIQKILPKTYIYSCPVWIAMSTVIRDLKAPPVLLIGCDQGDPYRVLEAWATIYDLDVNSKDLVLTDTRTAEFLKLAHNSWCCTKMSYMGFLKDQAEELNININDVSRFFQNGGERPGTFWRPGPSFSGPCFPRDLKFWNDLTSHPITHYAELINKNRVLEIVASIPENSSVLILGSGYKYGVDITEGSLSLMLREAFGKYRPKTRVVISDAEWNQLEWISKQVFTHCIVAHKELESYTPSNCEVIKLW